MTQFVAAFDNVIIKRFNSNREPQDEVQVRYVFSPKQRVLYDIANKSQNITIPVVAVSITNISRDNDRVFNKIAGFYTSRTKEEEQSSPNYSYLRSPVPINVGVNMSIIAKFQTDMDQILSNFIPYNDPYIVISWKVPDAVKLAIPQEIRSEVLWSGDISLQYPTDISSSDKYRVIGDTSFTVKGWLFKDNSSSTGKNIFEINNNFNLANNIDSIQSFIDSISAFTAE